MPKLTGEKVHYKRIYAQAYRSETENTHQQMLRLTGDKLTLNTNICASLQMTNVKHRKNAQA